MRVTANSTGTSGNLGPRDAEGGYVLEDIVVPILTTKADKMVGDVSEGLGRCVARCVDRSDLCAVWKRLGLRCHASRAPNAWAAAACLDFQV
jgi:hypothetical protein